MNDADFRRQLEEEAARGPADSQKNLGRLFDGLSAARVPYVRAHVAFAALDAYLMMAVDIFGRKGTVFALQRRPSDLIVSRGSQTVACTHFLDQAAIGLKYTGMHPNPGSLPMPESGFPCVADIWKPSGADLLFEVDRSEIQDKVRAITAFLVVA